jgi:exosortase/archaeosortase family protein
MTAVRAFVQAHPQARFWGIALALYVLWWLGYEQVLRPDGRLDAALSAQVAWAAAWGLRAFGFAAAVAPTNATLVTMAGDPAVLVGSPCNGLVLYALFAGFVLAQPDNGRRRGRFIVIGIATLYLVNVLRVAALALNHTYWYHTVDFNHHYTFTFVAYAVILGLWGWWSQQQPAASAHEPAIGA